MKTVFLDRDGVINLNKDGGYVTSWTEFQFLPGALSALRRLAEAQWRVVVVTNQSAVHRGLITARELDLLHGRMRGLVAAAGGWIDAVYYCPHRPEERCPCRKPRPGLLRRAATELGIDLAASWLVGDHWTDIAAAQAAGCRAVLVRSGRGGAQWPAGIRPSFVAADLAGAADLMLAWAPASPPLASTAPTGGAAGPVAQPSRASASSSLAHGHWPADGA